MFLEFYWSLLYIMPRGLPLRWSTFRGGHELRIGNSRYRQLHFYFYRALLQHIQRHSSISCEIDATRNKTGRSENNFCTTDYGWHFEVSQGRDFDTKRNEETRFISAHIWSAMNCGAFKSFSGRAGVSDLYPALAKHVAGNRAKGSGSPGS